MNYLPRLGLAGAVMLAASAPPPAQAAVQVPINPPAGLKDYQALARLPDFSGVWLPDVADQAKQVLSNPLPWTESAAKRIAQLAAEEIAGHPFPIIDHCFPTGMPSYMLITHNAFELLVTPGRVTLLGEGDGNRLRRIYTDGRPHPADPDPSFHGHSIGRWEGKTLLVDTVAVLPQSYLAVSEAVGVPNNGDMHIVEHLHLDGADLLLDDLEVTAPKVLNKPWYSTRRYKRRREQKYDIVEGVCTEGQFLEGVDKSGNATFLPVPFINGVPSGAASQ